MEGGISGLKYPMIGNSVAGMGRLCAYLDRVVPGPYRGLLIPKAGRMGLVAEFVGRRVGRHLLLWHHSLNDRWWRHCFRVIDLQHSVEAWIRITPTPTGVLRTVRFWSRASKTWSHPQSLNGTEQLRFVLPGPSIARIFLLWLNIVRRIERCATM